MFLNYYFERMPKEAVANFRVLQQYPVKEGGGLI
jgi:hypothetical protein